MEKDKLTAEDFKNILSLLANAWSKRDYELALGVFAEDVYYTDPLRYTFKGRGELKSFFEDDEGNEQKTQWLTIIFDEQQQAGAAEYIYEGTYRYYGVALIKVHEGLITEWREYQHADNLN